MTRPAVAAAGAAGAAVTALILRRRPPAHPRWQRRNYRDRPVTLAGGPALAIGALAAAGVAGAPGAAAAAAVAAGLGLYDDLLGDTHARGLRGHWRALRAGRVTTGLVKLVGMSAGGFAVGLHDRRRLGAASSDAMLIAGTANLVNLLDLRPGRAFKAATLVAVAAAPAPPPAGLVATGIVAASVVLLPADLGERDMLGDCGANTLGATLGWCLTRALHPRGRAAALGAVVGLTLVSELVSFTDLIGRTPWLRAVDEWGRPQ